AWRTDAARATFAEGSVQSLPRDCWSKDLMALGSPPGEPKSSTGAFMPPLLPQPESSCPVSAACPTSCQPRGAASPPSSALSCHREYHDASNFHEVLTGTMRPGRRKFLHLSLAALAGASREDAWLRAWEAGPPPLRRSPRDPAVHLTLISPMLRHPR